MKTITLYDPQVLKEENGLVYMPIEFLVISNLLYKDYNIKIFDCTDNIDEIINSAKNSICVGITTSTGYQIADGLKIAKLVRKANPKVPIVWGGWHPSLLPSQTLEDEHVDIIVRGQGERTFYELVKALEKGKSLKDIKGVSYKENGKSVHNPDRPFEGVDNFAELPYHLIDVERYLKKTNFGKRTISYISSQGCPYNCNFCADRAVYKGNWRGLDAEKVVKELKFLKEKYKIDSVQFLDNNFFLNEERDRKVIQGLIDLGLTWGDALGRVNILLSYSDDTWELMRKSKLHSIIIGAESGLDSSLKLDNKEITVRDIINFYKRCNKYNVGVVASFILGVPGVSKDKVKEEFDATVKLMYKTWRGHIDRNEVYYSTFTPFPGSHFYEVAKELGFKEPKSFEEWSRFYYVSDIRKVGIFVPWIDQKYAKLVEMVPFYFYVCSKKYQKQIIEKFRAPLSWALLGMEFVFRSVARLRLRTRIFNFPIEYYFLDGLVRLKKQSE